MVQSLKLIAKKCLISSEEKFLKNSMELVIVLKFINE